jgi:hypothetical protein
MKRLHLFEFEDLTWFPVILRDCITDSLQYSANKYDYYKGIVPLLKKGITVSGTKRIIDLASGGSGGWLKLSEPLAKEIPDLEIRLTDYYPNLAAFKNIQRQGGKVFSFEAKSVDAQDVPEDFQGLRTMFVSLHHFKPNDARQILQNAVDAGQPIAVFDIMERSFLWFIICLIFVPIGLLINTPFIRPFKISRILFTYFIPIVPLITLWDGLISVLRNYTPLELEAMTKELKGGDKYQWLIGKKQEKGRVPITYLLGLPRSQ